MKIRTAAYCRVSTDLEEQEGSYDFQIAYYHNRILCDPTMELVGVYGDKGKSGRSVTSRSGLKHLIADCEAGKVDLVLTKSLSRFSRNMADCMEFVRKLRDLKVTIFFEKENIRTDTMKSELLIGILAALAQEESNSISQNTTRSHLQFASEGRPYGRITYGYYRTGEKAWQINPDEARRVRLAFTMAAEGRKYNEILDALNDMERQENTGVVWLQKRLKYMLRNVAYTGDFFSHGTVCLTPGHQVVNRGYRDRYFIEEHHEPMVSKTLFDRVQKVFESGILISYKPLTEESRKILLDDSWREEIA